MSTWKHAVRGLAKSPALVVVAVVTLALGIGPTTAIFSVVDAVVLRPLPFPDGERLVQLGDTRTTSRPNEFGTSWSWPNYESVKQQSRTLKGVAVFTGGQASLTGRGDARQIDTTVSSADLFRVIGAKPFLGRDFAPEEDTPGKNTVVILGHSYWQSELGGDRNVIGQTMVLNGVPRTVIGVMPQGFTFPLQQQPEPKMYLTFPDGPLDAHMRTQRGAHWAWVVGRLADGRTVTEASAELETIRARLAEEFPDNLKNRIFQVKQLHEFLIKDVSLGLLVILGAVALVLLIACTNVANLLLARASVRHREIAIRLALGASRRRIIWDVLVESLLLSLVGCGVGIVLALWGVDWLRGMVPAEIGAIRPLVIDARVLAFAVGTSLATGLIFGLIPAAQALKAQAGEALQQAAARGGNRKTRLRSVLVAVEISLAMMLLVGAGLLLRSFANLQKVDPGFDPNHLTVGTISLPSATYQDDPQWIAFFQRLEAQLAGIPGAESAIAVPPPLTGSNMGFTISFVGRPPPKPGERLVTGFRAGSSGIFTTLRVPLKRGRTFTAAEEDPKQPRVLVVSEAFVKKFYPDEDPIGKRVIIGFGDPVEREIIGVVGDIKERGLTEDTTPTSYAPYPHTPLPFMSVLIRSPAPQAAAMRAAVQAVDKNVPIDIKPMEEYMRDAVAQQRLLMQLLVMFAGVALTLALVGVYGVVSYGVTQRMQELSVRSALGARPAQLIGMIVRHGLLLAVAGVVVGAVAALILFQMVVTSLLFGVGGMDPLTYAGVASLLVAVTAAASFIPARRAARLDPMAVLRSE
jgi:putative ABC transport system permease protein